MPIEKKSIKLAFSGVAPGHALPLDNNDKLFVNVWSSASTPNLMFHARQTNLDGNIVHNDIQVQPNSSKTKSTHTVDLSAGWLHSVHCRVASTTVRAGQVFVRLGIARNTSSDDTDQMILCQGYISSESDLSWPPGKSQQAVDGPPRLRSVAGTDQAANTEVSENVPSNTRYMLKSLSVALTTDATAANRTVCLYVDDGTTKFFQVRAGITQAASLTYTYDFVAGYPVRDSALGADNRVIVPLPPDLLLFQGWRFKTQTVNMQAGDNYAAPQMMVYEWIEE